MDFAGVLNYLSDNWFNIAVTAFTAVSGTIAYLTWKDSRRGPEIQVITPVSFEPVAYTSDVDSPFRRNMFFRFPLIFQNKGARVGTIIGLSCSVREPAWKYETNRDGVRSTEFTESTVSLQRQKFQHYDPASYSIELRENDTASLTVTVSFALTDAEPDKRRPEKTFQELMKSTSVILAIQYQASTSKGKLESKNLVLIANPIFKVNPA
jgi:hypothetical protein